MRCQALPAERQPEPEAAGEGRLAEARVWRCDNSRSRAPAPLRRVTDGFPERKPVPAPDAGYRFAPSKRVELVE